MKPIYMSATGNRFMVLDGFADNLPSAEAELSELARRSSISRGDTIARGAPWSPDGLVVISPPSEPGEIDFVFSIYNRDGTRAEACGNGLRAAGAVAWLRGYAEGKQLVQTDIGSRIVEIYSQDRRHLDVRVQVGAVRIVDMLTTLELSPDESVEVSIVNAGNPHAVMWVSDEREVDIERIGAAIEQHPRFPRGANVGFLSVRDETAHLRVWERGVGETRACGTGACAAAVVLRERQDWTLPLEISMPGGQLTIDAIGPESYLRGIVDLR